jgi:hypothetical protein
LHLTTEILLAQLEIVNLTLKIWNLVCLSVISFTHESIVSQFPNFPKCALEGRRTYDWGMTLEGSPYLPFKGLSMEDYDSFAPLLASDDLRDELYDAVAEVEKLRQREDARQARAAQRAK